MVRKTFAAAAKCAERIIQCSDGIKLAAKQWSVPSSASPATRRVLCLHGQADNAASFHIVAPALFQSQEYFRDVVALDFPGHGLSSHRSTDATIDLPDYAIYIHEAARGLDWQRFSLVGHSMGAFVAVLYAAAFPQNVTSLVLLEGGQPLLPRDEQDIGGHIRAAVQRRVACNERTSRKQRQTFYPSLEAAVRVRVFNQGLLPGKQTISWEAAEALVRRGTVTQRADGTIKYRFRHDVRVQWPPLRYYSHAELNRLYRGVKCPVCRIMAEAGWPFEKTSTEAISKVLRPTVSRILPGQHHFHADRETAPAVAEQIEDFLDAYDRQVAEP